MAKKVEAQAKVGVCVGALWRALTKDLSHVMQKAAPNLVRDVEILEGDGGLGSVLLIHFGSDVKHISYQKEKIVELDEAKLHVGTSFMLTEVGEDETLVDITVTYESEREDAALPERTKEASLFYIRSLENYFQKVSV